VHKYSLLRSTAHRAAVCNIHTRASLAENARRHAVALSRCVCVCVRRAATARRSSLGGEGNALYSLLSSSVLQVFGLYLSTYVIVIISIDRCMAIVDPISKNRAPRRVRLMLLVAWVISAAFSLPQVFIIHASLIYMNSIFLLMSSVYTYSNASQSTAKSCGDVKIV